MEYGDQVLQDPTAHAAKLQAVERGADEAEAEIDLPQLVVDQQKHGVSQDTPSHPVNC